MNFKIFYIGKNIEANTGFEHDLILLIIKKITGKNIEIVTKIADADLTIVYPYYVSAFKFKFKWLMIWLISKVRPIEDKTIAFNWLFGIGKHKTLFISHENLDRPYWWNTLGRLLISSKIPRLTFWPKEIDPNGARFPYWYNYVDWPDYPRPNFYERFGRLYRINELCSPLNPGKINRNDRAIAIASHLDHPRKAILKSIAKKMQVDIYGRIGNPLVRTKLEVMEEYKYAICPENSTGFGYETEKIPEAWVAGCIPVGIFLNPYSQFNQKLTAYGDEYSSEAPKFSLLEEAPSLLEIENYVKAILRS